MASSARLHELEISRRPRNTWPQNLSGLLYTIIFNLGCVMINGFQFIVLLPLKLFGPAQALYDAGIRYSKGAFGTLLVLVTQLFGPTTLVISFEREGPGRFTEDEIRKVVERDESGNVVALHLPRKSVLIANHQVYADWWYAWCLTYFMGTHRDVFIVLKKSLKWVPVVGWGMQFYKFIFLDRSWASDRLHLAQSLSWLADHAEKQETPLTFILYPEGTLVSKDTRPVSKKYADKMGIPDLHNTLLPRSTGLHYSLRSLAPRLPNLQLIDITVAYPGIPAGGYGQSYYTLRSIFLDGVPPPQVHIHIRKFDVSRDVPIGDLSASNPSVIPNGDAKVQPLETEIPQKERDDFDEWLQDLWRRKDQDMSRFLEEGAFVTEPNARVEVPVTLKHFYEAPNAFCLFLPAYVSWKLYKLFR